ncbi:MAG: hypothetical protein WBD36_12910 [Bacteroidota bacterium]
MNVRTICAWVTIAVLSLYLGCQNPVAEQPGGGTNTVATRVTGFVDRNDTGQKVPGVIVQDIGGLAKDTTKANGSFSLTYQVPDPSLVLRIYPTYPAGGFKYDTSRFTLRQGVDTSISLTLKADSTSPPTSPSSGKPANIVLKTASETNIGIRGAGLNESSLLTFEVRDSVGNPVIGTSRVTVYFSILGGPGGGEYVFPASAVTDASGKVSTRVTSGTKPGVLQVNATAQADSLSPTIKSSPVRLTISGGLPDANHFSINTDKVNIPGGIFDNVRAKIGVILGDKFGNPVPPLTAVYFSSTGGIIQSTGFTDKDGLASVDLISAAPRPAIVTVTARTVGDTSTSKADSVVSRSIIILFSRDTRFVPPSAQIIVPDSGETPFSFRVSDLNGYPLVAGSSITTTVSGNGSAGVKLEGDAQRTMPDTKDTTQTFFILKAVKSSRGGSSGFITFTVTIKSTNGDLTQQFAGYVTPGGGTASGGLGTPSSIEAVGFAPTTLSVRGTGQRETATITFVVKDSTGNPVANPLDPTKKVAVAFSISPSTGGAFVFPVTDSTNNNGQVATTFNSGTVSGVYQVTAQTFVAGRGIVSSSPVKITVGGGLPDSNAITVSLSKVNMPGLVKFGQLGTVTVQVGDKFGNPVQSGTALSFSTTGGLIQLAASTSEAGQASAQLSGGAPYPPNGLGLATVQTLGENGVQIRKQVPFLFTGAPRINISPSYAGFQIPDSGSFPFNFNVRDANNNPLSSGTTITVSLSGPASPDLQLSGDVSRTMPDTQDTTLTNFKVTILDSKRAGLAGKVDVTITVSGENGTASTTFSGDLLAAGVNPGGFSGGNPSSIQLVGISNSNISVRGTGATETSTLSFQVKDSLGNPIPSSKQVTVNFSIVGGPGGGEFVFPASMVTDVNGRISTTVNSGTKSGVLQIVDTIYAPGRVITSSPTQITISGGLPDSNRITTTITRFNLPGIVKSGTLATISVQTGDKFGNPAQPSACYFSTTGGIITASATTDASGHASVSLSGGNSIPAGGRGVVTMQTHGENGITIQKQIPFLFTGAPLIFTPASGFQIADSGNYAFNFKVADLNGNPLASGNTVTVSLSGASNELQLSGDATRTMPDTQDTTLTNFSVVVTDTKKGGASGQVTVTVSVTGDNGTASQSFTGTLLASGVSPGGAGGGYASSISLVSPPSPSVISVQGTGANETSTLTFQVKDSVGNPITQQRQVTVRFALQGGPGGGEFLFPTSSVTDANGLVRTTLNAGTKAGVIQVIDSITVGTKIIISSPVNLTIAGGLPDQNHFTVWADKANYPGLVAQGGVIGRVNVQAGDLYGNPSQPSSVYFTTTGGNIDATMTTNLTGSGSVNLYGGNPAPIGGIDTITVSTAGVGGATVSRKVNVLFSGPPVITVPPSGFQVPDSGGYTFSFKVADVNNNPLSLGNVINVGLSGAAASDEVLSGDLSRTTIDTKDTSLTNFSVTIRDTRREGLSGTLTVTIEVNGPNGTAARSFSGTLVASGSASTSPSGGYASAIQLFSSPSAQTISVRGTGSTESSTLTFVVKDSLGNPITEARQVTLNFSILGGPNGGEYVFPASVTTDASGHATTTLTSGTKSGVLQLVATTVVNGRTITSAPVPLTIASGLPDLAHFTISSSVANWPGIVAEGSELGRVFAQVGDMYGNPVQPNTAVYFTTNAGIIEHSGFTDATGHALNTARQLGVRVYGGSPFPPQGIDTITASTVGPSGVTVSKFVTVVFSGAPVVYVPTLDPNDTLPAINADGFVDLGYAIADANSNPLAAGNLITVGASGEAASKLSLSGNISVVTADSKTKIIGAPYTVRITNNVTSGGTGGAFVITISVSGPNGIQSRNIYGKLLAPAAVVPPSPTARAPAQIAFLSLSTSNLFVAGVGGTENAVIAYQVNDSLGQPIDKSLRTYATFTTNFYPNSLVFGGSAPTLIPNADSTNDQGQLHVSVVSGTQAGVLQVVARIQLGGGVTITSQPVRISVHAGFADRGHFTLRPQRYVFPGFEALNTVTFTAAIGDTFSNPVAQGTDVYFHTQAGVITTGATTDVNGFVSSTLYTLNPMPDAGGSALAGRPTFDASAGAGNGRPGYQWVYAQTKGNFNTSIIDSILVVWTKAPITVTGISGATVVSIPTGGTSAPIAFTVKDGNGNPLPDGTTISVSFVLPQTSTQLAFNATGDFTSQNPATIPNAGYARFPGAGVTDFSISFTDVSNPAAPTTISIGIVITINAPGIGTKQVSFTGDIN